MPHNLRINSLWKNLQKVRARKNPGGFPFPNWQKLAHMRHACESSTCSRFSCNIFFVLPNDHLKWILAFPSFLNSSRSPHEGQEGFVGKGCVNLTSPLESGSFCLLSKMLPPFSSSDFVTASFWIQRFFLGDWGCKRWWCEAQLGRRVLASPKEPRPQVRLLLAAILSQGHCQVWKYSLPSLYWFFFFLKFLFFSGFLKCTETKRTRNEWVDSMQLFWTQTR